MAGLNRTTKEMKSKSSLREKLDPLGLSEGKVDPSRIENSFANPLKTVESSVSNLSSAFTPDIPEIDEQPLIPIPDEMTAATKARKRRARAVGTGRESTILTEALGG